MSSKQVSRCLGEFAPGKSSGRQTRMCKLSSKEVSKCLGEFAPGKSSVRQTRMFKSKSVVGLEEHVCVFVVVVGLTLAWRELA